MPHVSADAFASLVGFLYSDTLDPDIQPGAAMELLLLAHEFMLKPLEQLCEVGMEHAVLLVLLACACNSCLCSDCVFIDRRLS